MSPQSEPRRKGLEISSTRKWTASFSNYPRILICSVFVIWKGLLIFLLTLSPSPGYDSSSVHLLGHSHEPAEPSPTSTAFSTVANRLLRWDAVFFASAARNGYSYEHEWAFSWGASRVTKLVETCLSRLWHFESQTGLGHNVETDNLLTYVLSGALVSILAHLLSALVLYQIVVLLLFRNRISSPSHKHPAEHNTRTRVGDTNLAILVSLLHVFSPAGVFLIAPYSEALFSFLSFAGSALYLLGTRGSSDLGVEKNIYLILSGIAWSASTLIRSNGLFGGIAYVYCAVTDVLIPLKDDFDKPKTAGINWSALIQRGFALGVSSCSLLLSFGYPQWRAYREFCKCSPHTLESAPSPCPSWCTNTIPAVYPYIQAKYWNVGFLRYWTLSNIPLFFIATPTLYLLIQTSLKSIKSLRSSRPESRSWRILHSLAPLAMIQLVLACLAITNYHVQIIIRLASGYPVWYIVLGLCIQEEKLSGSAKGTALHVPTRVVVGWMVAYGLIQLALFSSFLPPA